MVVIIISIGWYVVNLKLCSLNDWLIHWSFNNNNNNNKAHFVCYI
jgi:hypothetical protein